MLTPAELALLRPADVADLMPEPGTGTPRFPNGSGNGDRTEKPSLDKPAPQPPRHAP